jgi:hypothetical protein
VVRADAQTAPLRAQRRDRRPFVAVRVVALGRGQIHYAVVSASTPDDLCWTREREGRAENRLRGHGGAHSFLPTWVEHHINTDHLPITQSNSNKGNFGTGGSGTYHLRHEP